MRLESLEYRGCVGVGGGGSVAEGTLNEAFGRDDYADVQKQSKDGIAKKDMNEQSEGDSYVFMN